MLSTNSLDQTLSLDKLHITTPGGKSARMDSTQGDHEERRPHLSLHWSQERRFESLYNRGKPQYNEKHGVLFCLYDSRLHVIDQGSSAILATIGGLGDHITAFAVDQQGDNLVAACSSFLFRVYRFDWDEFRKKYARNTYLRGTDAAYAPDVQHNTGAHPDSSNQMLKCHEIRCWKVHRALSTTLSISSFPNVSPLVASGFMDGCIYVYDATTGHCTHVFPKHSGSIGVVRFHPSRLLLFSSSDDGEIRIHDPYRHISIACLRDHLSLPTDVDFILPDKEHGQMETTSLGGLVSCSRDRIVNIWNLDDLDKQFSESVSNEAKKNPCGFKRRGITFHVGLPVEHAEYWLADTEPTVEMKSKKKKHRQHDHEESSPPTIKLLKQWYNEHFSNTVLTLTPVHQLSVNESLESLCIISSSIMSHCEVSNAGFNAQKVETLCPWIIATGGELGHMTLWNPQTRQRIATIMTPHSSKGTMFFLKLCTSPLGVPWLLSAGSDHTIVFWNLRTLRVERVVLGTGSELIHCQFINVPASHSLTYDQASRQQGDMDANKDTKTGCSKRALLLRSDPTCVLFDMSIDRTSATILSGHTDTVLCCDSTPEGCWVVTGSKDHTVRVWSTRAAQCVAVFECHTAPVVGVKTNRACSTGVCSCSPQHTGSHFKGDSKGAAHDFFFLSVCLDGVMKLCRVDHDTLRKRIQHDVDQHRDATLFDADHANDPLPTDQFTPAPPLIITTIERSVNAHEKEINALAIAPNNKLAATASADKTVKVWSLPGMVCVGVCSGHTRSVSAVQFSPIEKVIATGSADQTIRLWNIKDMSCLKAFQGHRSSILSLQFLSYGTQLVSSSGDGQIKVWTIRTSECVCSLDDHDTHKIWSISTSSSQRELLSGSANHVLILWKDTTEEFQQRQAEKAQKDAGDLLEIDVLTQAGKLLQALSLTLKLRRPFHMQRILEESYKNTLLHRYDQDTTTHMGPPSAAGKILAQYTQSKFIAHIAPNELEHWVSGLSESELKTLVEFIVQWNTNGRTSSLANSVLQLLLQNVSFKTLLRIEGFPTLASAFLAYVPRHIHRINALIQRTFILDMILLTSNDNPLMDGPTLPGRVDDTEDVNASLRALSLEDTVKTFFT